MLAVLLALCSATTTIGPELVERFTLPDQPGPFAVSGVDEVVTVNARVLVRRALDGTERETVQLPCDAIDVAAGERAWAVLCADRVVMERKRFGDEVSRQVVQLAPQSARPALLAVHTFHGSWIVVYEDGLVQRGRFDGNARVEEIDLRAQPLSLVLSGISDGTVSLADGSQHTWRGSQVEEVTSTTRSLVELFEASASSTSPDAAKRARVSRNVSSGSATMRHTKHGAFAVSTSARIDAIDAIDVSNSDDVVCTRTAATLTCYGEPLPAPPEIAPRDVVPDGRDGNDGAPRVPRDILGEEPEFEAPLDFSTPGSIAALVSTALGVGAFASAPFAMQALSPSLGIAPAFALAGLGAVAGVASFAVVASAVIIVGAVIFAAIPDDRPSSANAGMCAPGVQILEGAIDDCLCALATIVGIAGALVATASVGVAALTVASMPPVDAALGGRAPATDPFFPTWGGATVGGLVGFGVGAGISFATSPLRDDDDDGESDDELTVVLDTVQTLTFVVAGSAVGASIGYGVARGP